MIELLITSIPFVLRVAYLRWRGIPVTLYNVQLALFAWLVLALAVFFAVFYYYPKSYTGLVPFWTVPVVAEQGGTVTDLKVGMGERVEPGRLLFTVEDTTERAAVRVAEQRLEEINQEFATAEAEVRSARARLERANALLEQANNRLADQEELRKRRSTAFREIEYERAVATKAANAADVAVAQSALETANVELTALLPARRESAIAALEQAKVELDKTKVRSQVAGVVEQLTLNIGARAAQIAASPAMVIVPNEQPKIIVAGFSQAARSVLHVGMPAEVACESNFNIAMKDVVLPARVKSIQDAIAAGQLAPTGRLLEPAERAQRGEIVVIFELEHPEQRSLLMNGSGCMVQAYTTSLGHGIIAHGIHALGVLKAVLLRIKVWIALAAGIGLGGGGH